MNHGLRPLIKDEKDFRVGALMKLSSTFPETFECVIPPEWVRSQSYDTCADEATSNLLSYINSIRLEALIAWVIARSNDGYKVEEWGLDLKSMMLGAVKVGALPFDASPFKTTDDRDKFADITSWNLSKLLPQAILYRAGSAVFIEPTNGMDMFDTIKATMFKLNAPVVIGVNWNWPLNVSLIDTPQEEGNGHAMLVVGWNKTRLKVLNSYGTDVGENGYFFFSREVINHDCDKFGASTLIDETPEKIRWHLDNKIYLDDRNWLLNLIKTFLLSLKSLIQKQSVGVPPYPQRMVDLSEAMARKEGFYVFASRPKRNHNPINARFVGQYKAIGEDRREIPEGQNGFAIFPDDITGWEYWHKVLYSHCTGKSAVYNDKAHKLGLKDSSELTLLQYISIFAPSNDGNDPVKYCNDVCIWTGLKPDTRLKELLYA